jgi:Uma2 family endonuclease
MRTGPVKRHATYADVLAAPANMVAELIEGALVTQPRPSPRHGVAASSLGEELMGPFQKGRGGPGGWIFVDEPELHLGEDVVVPDIAGWRSERLRALPETPYFTQPPDWVCEVLSPSTENLDKGPKRRIYAGADIPYLWLGDPRAKLIEGFALTAEQSLVGKVADADEVRLAPFEAVSFPLSALWPLDPTSSDPSAEDA